MTRTNDAELQLFHAIINDELTLQQRTTLALLVHAIGTQAPDGEGLQAATWRFVRCDYAKLLDAYLRPSAHTQTREAR